jgi:hypothetical protein
MASNKKPSLYSDRGSIGSANELDEYGVWVKSEPQVLSADGADTDKSGDLDDSVLSPVEFSSDELTADDALSFDDAVLDVNAASQEGSSAFSDMEFPDDNIEIETGGGSFSLDSNLDDLNITDTELAVPKEDNLQSDNFEIEDTSFDDFETPSVDSESETEASAGDNFEIKDDLDFDDFSDLTASEPEKSDDSAGADNFETDDFETDNFTVPTVKAIENDIENIQDDFDSVLNTKENNLSTQLLLKIAEELSSIRGELSELKREFSGLRPAVSAEDDKHDQSGFFSEEDDETIALTGDELDNILGGADTGEPVQQEAAPAVEDDDDDETIALTGDELDNILNSADFTEESGTNETVENDFSLDEEPMAPPEETEIAQSDDDIVLDADLVNLDEDADLSADLASLSETDDLGSIPAPEEEETVDLSMDLTASDEDGDLDMGLKALGDDELGSGLAQEEDEEADLDMGLKALGDDELGSGLASEDEEEADLSMDLTATGEDVDLSADLATADEDADLSADLSSLGETDDLDTGIKALGDDEFGSGLAPADEEDINLGMDLSATDEDADLGMDLAASDEDADLGMDLSATDEDADLGMDLAASDEDADLSASLGEGDDLDMGLKALDDDELGSGLAPEEDEDVDLSMDITATDEDADLSMDLAALGETDDLDTGITALGDDELGSGLAPEEEDISQAGEELIDIDTDDLNIDLDPDTLLNESAEGADTDLSGLELTDDIPADSEKHDSPELEQLRSEGVTPITTAPENSSYLESEEDAHPDSLDLSDAVIDEPVLSTDGINDDLEEPSLNDSEFDLDALDDLTIDAPEIESKPEETPALSQDAFEDIDIDIPPEQPAEQADDFSPETGAFDAEETVIPEGFEAEIEEKPVPFDDDLDEDIAANDFNDALGLPGVADDDFVVDDSPFEDLSFNEPPVAPVPPKAAPKKAPAPKEAPAPKAAPEPQAAAQEEAEIPSVPVPQAPVPPPNLGKDAFKIPSALKLELRNILSYMDQLLESLPEEKIEEFAKSTYFDSYKKLFKELGLV